MSGGSFNYLCNRDFNDLLYWGIGDEWDRMLNELDELCPEAAKEMRRIRLESQRFLEEHESQWNELQPVLHAIEWWRSNDYSVEDVYDAISKYRSNHENDAPSPDISEKARHLADVAARAVVGPNSFSKNYHGLQQELGKAIAEVRLALNKVEP